MIESTLRKFVVTRAVTPHRQSGRRRDVTPAGESAARAAGICASITIVQQASQQLAKDSFRRIMMNLLWVGLPNVADARLRRSSSIGRGKASARRALPQIANGAPRHRPALGRSGILIVVRPK
jgi:hypothetical protein